MRVGERTATPDVYDRTSAVSVAPSWERGPARPTLRAGEVHVWLAPIDGAEIWTHLHTLSADERARCTRMPLASRRRFLATRAMLREILGAYLGIAPERVPIRARAGGKPELAAASTSVTFNVTHANDLAAVAVADRREVGIDIAGERLVEGWERIADRVFPATEVAALHASPPVERAAAFARAWARTEARLKAIGRGLTGGGERDGEGGFLRTYEFGNGGGWAGALAVDGEPERIRWWRFEACADAEDCGPA
jgi:4'-phosphopantetheinyl transferase